MKKINCTNPYSNNLLNKVLYSGITFLANALLTRFLGTQLKGDYTWVLNTANLLSIVAGLGVYQSIPFFNRKSTNEENIIQDYVNMFSFQFLVYLVLSILIVCVSQSILVSLVAFLMNVDMLSQQLNMLMLISDIRKRNRIFLSGAILNLGLCAIVYAWGVSNLYAAIAITLIIKIFYIIGYLFTMRIIPRPLKIDFRRIAERIKFGYLPMLSFLLITLNYKVDILMLKADTDISSLELSLYSVGVSIAEIAWFIPDVFKEVVFAKTAKKNEYEEVASVIRISNAVMAMVILGILVLGKGFIRIFYGNDFVNAYKVTVVLFMGIPAMCWFKIIYTLFNAQGKRKISFLVLLMSAAINILLNLILIPLIGIIGAAAASVFTYLCCGIIFLVLFGRASKIPLRKLFFMRKDDIKIFK